jgi:hypothetical protein
MGADPPKSIYDRQFSDSCHMQIVNRLEKAKAFGLIANFFVRTGAHGQSGCSRLEEPRESRNPNKGPQSAGPWRT